MKRDAYKLLAEKYQQINETTGEQAMQSVRKLSEVTNSIEIQSHYGNVVLPIVEIWKQDGVLKISVEDSAGVKI